MIGQIIGIIATFFTIFSFQQKTAKNILIFQFAGSVLWAIHFYMLGAVTGACINAIAAVRSMAFYKTGKSVEKKNRMTFLFVALSVVIYIFTLAMSWNGWDLSKLLIELLPILGFTAATVALKMNEASKVRLFSLASMPPWLLYNIIKFSLGGIITKSFSILSIISGIIRLDRKRSES